MTQKYKSNKFLNKFRHIQFNTRINLSSDDIFDVYKFKTLKQINSDKNFFSYQPIITIADPFLYCFRDELFLFYEELKGMNGTGIIRMIKTNDLKNWSKPKTVLKESFHLSFPNVFQIDGQVFMMPETGQSKSIRLYTPNNDLTKWELHKTILTGKSYVDSSIIIFNKNLYLFTTDNSEGSNILRLYISDKVDGKWIEHPMSPITYDINRGRCGGSVFFYNRRIYRPTQLYNINYGDGLDIYEVNSLSPTEFKETRVANIFPSLDKFYSLGGHHISICSFKNKNIIATDALAYNYNFFEIVRRITSKIQNFNFI